MLSSGENNVHLIVELNFKGAQATQITSENIDDSRKIARTALSWMGLPHPKLSSMIVYRPGSVFSFWETYGKSQLLVSTMMRFEQFEFDLDWLSLESVKWAVLPTSLVGSLTEPNAGVTVSMAMLSSRALKKATFALDALRQRGKNHSGGPEPGIVARRFTSTFVDVPNVIESFVNGVAKLPARPQTLPFVKFSPKEVVARPMAHSYSELNDSYQEGSSRLLVRSDSLCSLSTSVSKRLWHDLDRKINEPQLSLDRKDRKQEQKNAFVADVAKQYNGQDLEPSISGDGPMNMDIDSESNEDGGGVNTMLQPEQLIETLKGQLEEARRVAREASEQEATILRRLKEMGAHNAVSDNGDSGNIESQSEDNGAQSMSELMAELADEKERRRLAETALMDVQREGIDPFVVPALLEAFSLVSGLTTRALVIDR